MSDSGDQDRGVKREFEDDTQQASQGGLLKKKKGDGPKYDLRILLQSKNAGAIIGKAGANINRLRKDYNATVQVPDCNGPERVLVISANLGTVLEVLLDIIPYLEDYQGHSDLNFDCEIRMLVHQSQAGAIIGRAGYKIKDLREKTSTNIKVYSLCCPHSTERVIAVGKKPVDVVNCIGIIIDHLLEQAPPKGASTPYDPINCDERYAFDYGGFTTEDNFGPSNVGWGGRSSRGPRGGGGGRGGGRFNRGGYDDDDEPRYGGGRGRGFGRGPRGGSGGSRNGFNRGGGGGNDYGGGYGGGAPGNYGGGHGNFGNQGGFGGGSVSGGMPGGSMGGDGGFGAAPGGAPGGVDGSQEVQKQQVSIPKNLAGSIIGKQGKRISQIRMRSNAEIKIDEPLPGSNDRIITISGTPDQIQNAQWLLQQSVKDHSGHGGGGQFGGGQY